MQRAEMRPRTCTHLHHIVAKLVPHEVDQAGGAHTCLVHHGAAEGEGSGQGRRG